MDRLERIIQVTWHHRVFFVSRVFDHANTALRDVLATEREAQRPKAFVVVDAGLARSRPSLTEEISRWFQAHADVVELAGTPLVLEGGEVVKNSPEAVERLLTEIHSRHIDRQSFVIAVGGGALLDAVGYAAAVAHRGCRHIRVPTTTLSQADSGIGVKNGINAFGKKNFIGTFCPPFAVLNDFDLLATLPDREKRAGYVEAVKVACIRDRTFFDEIERNLQALRDFEAGAVQQLIRRSAQLHLDHIATMGDPFEFGSARPLDFGHWAAHKLEQLSYFTISHGEAVAVGVAIDALYSRNLGWLQAAEAERILSLLERLGLDLAVAELSHTDALNKPLLLAGIDEFTEHLGGQLCITLLRDIGRGFEVHEMNPDQVMACVRELQARPTAASA